MVNEHPYFLGVQKYFLGVQKYSLGVLEYFLGVLEYSLGVQESFCDDSTHILWFIQSTARFF